MIIVIIIINFGHLLWICWLCLTYVLADNDNAMRWYIIKAKMAPKSKSRANPDDLKQEDILQAVVFADSFNNNFAPVSNDKPRVYILQVL